MAASFLASFCSLFQHANLRTPRWLGYLIQRPESHSIHHQRGVHAYNYGDIALWDLLFGTLRNPATFDGEAGYWDGASRRVTAMLLGLDVTARPPEGASAERGISRPPVVPGRDRVRA
jgi:sterol desaturase/sphingolipid hydroxylase (fatty acid hydroxylase superfamily)